MQKTQKDMANFDQAYWDDYFARHEVYPIKLLNEAFASLQQQLMMMFTYLAMMFIAEDQLSIQYLSYWVSQDAMY